MPIIREYTKSDKNIWDSYVMQHPDSTVFHLTSWKEVIEKTFGHRSIYLIALNSSCKRNSEVEKLGCWDAGKPESKKILKAKSELHYGFPASKPHAEVVVGLLPLFRIRSRFFGDYLTSLPFAEIGGIVTDDDTIAKQLLDRAVEIAKDIGCDYLELRNRKAVSDLPVKSLYFNFRREIFADKDRNMKAIPRKARRMVRQGIKHNLSSQIGHHLLDEFYQILATNFHRLGTPVFSKKYFKTFLNVFGNKANILAIRTKQNQPIASVFSFFFKDQVIPYYAGSDFDYRRLAPNDFMYWELMRYGCEEGYKIFDYGRSKADTGSYHFKRHWGFDPEPLAYQYHLVKRKELPNLSPSNPKYQKKIELWRKLPLPVTKILGPPIAKYLA